MLKWLGKISLPFMGPTYWGDRCLLPLCGLLGTTWPSDLRLTPLEKSSSFLALLALKGQVLQKDVQDPHVWLHRNQKSYVVIGQPPRPRKEGLGSKHHKPVISDWRLPQEGHLALQNIMRGVWIFNILFFQRSHPGVLLCMMGKWGELGLSNGHPEAQ